MIKVIICGHGQLAHAMKDSAEMIFGKIDSLYPITFEKREGIEELESKIKKQIDKQQSTLIIVDLFGGTPFNAAAKLALTSPSIDVITGMSLPICLEAVNNLDTLSLSELVSHLLEIGQGAVRKLDKTIILETEDDFI